MVASLSELPLVSHHCYFNPIHQNLCQRLRTRPHCTLQILPQLSIHWQIPCLQNLRVQNQYYIQKTSLQTQLQPMAPQTQIQTLQQAPTAHHHTILQYTLCTRFHHQRMLGHTTKSQIQAIQPRRTILTVAPSQKHRRTTQIHNHWRTQAHLPISKTHCTKSQSPSFNPSTTPPKFLQSSQRSSQKAHRGPQIKPLTVPHSHLQNQARHQSQNSQLTLQPQILGLQILLWPPHKCPCEHFLRQQPNLHTVNNHNVSPMHNSSATTSKNS